MTIRIEQTCDGCQATRVLYDLTQAQNGGWREVKQDTHLCPKCIANALKKVTT